VIRSTKKIRKEAIADETGGKINDICGSVQMIRANEIMTKAGETEVIILRKLAGADPSGKYHIVRMLGTFKYRNHLCIVFEPLVTPPPPSGFVIRSSVAHATSSVCECAAERWTSRSAWRMTYAGGSMWWKLHESAGSDRH